MAKPKPVYGAPVWREDELAIFTDGSMIPSPRRGGHACRMVWTADDGTEEFEDFPGQGYANARNNQMELVAVVEALRIVDKPYMRFDLSKISKIVVFTDSLIIAENHERARTTWKPNRWLGANGQPIDNAEEWDDLIKEKARLSRPDYRVEIKFCKGHNKTRNPHNDAVDKMAKEVARGAGKTQRRPTNPGRKLTKEKTARGNVKMEGQRMTIRIIDHTWNSKARLHSYRYEVITKASPFHGFPDVIYSAELMKRTHCYLVQVNREANNPRVTSVIREIEYSADRD